MIEINPTLWRTPPPYAHQLVGVRAIVRNEAFFLGDKPRIGKSRQVVDAACTLWQALEIGMVLIICPVPARAVWGDKVLGQIKKYSWLPNHVHEWRGKDSKDLWVDNYPIKLLWVITNYEYIRNPEKLAALTDRLKGRKFFLVLDETSAVGNHTSQQSKAVKKIRGMCTRVVMLNGTPGTPDKIYSQFNILNDLFNRLYSCSSFLRFKYKYGVWGKPQEVQARGKRSGTMKKVSQLVGWKDLDKLSRITAPYCLQRTRFDCPELRDIPIAHSYREVALTPETWRMYKELKRDALTVLGTGETYVSPNQGVCLMRLAQIVSGHLGGFADESVRDLSSEKIDWIVNHLINECNATNFIVWCRWRREREIVAARLAAAGVIVHQLYGGQPKTERRTAEMIFTDGAVRLPNRSYGMVAAPGAGGVALDMSAATEVFRLSMDFNPQTLEQSNDRPMGNAQKAEMVAFTTILATGPAGQRTMDHITAAALEEKMDLQKATCAYWRKVLEDE
jgi:SNF2-related domain